MLPIWKLPDPIRLLFPRQKKAGEAVKVRIETHTGLQGGGV